MWRDFCTITDRTETATSPEDSAVIGDGLESFPANSSANLNDIASGGKSFSVKRTVRSLFRKPTWLSPTKEPLRSLQQNGGDVNQTLSGDGTAGLSSVSEMV